MQLIRFCFIIHLFKIFIASNIILNDCIEKLLKACLPHSEYLNSDINLLVIYHDISSAIFYLLDNFHRRDSQIKNRFIYSTNFYLSPLLSIIQLDSYHICKVAVIPFLFNLVLDLPVQVNPSSTLHVDEHLSSEPIWSWKQLTYF